MDLVTPALGYVRHIAMSLAALSVWLVLLAVIFIWGHHMFIIGVSSPWVAAMWLFAFLLTLFASYLPRLLAVRRFKQPLKSAIIHPLGITLLLCIQWYALTRQLLGRPVGWRQRNYTPTTGAEL